VKIQARFTHDRLDHSKTNTTHLVVSVEAPALDWVEKRPSVAILPVIDLSGSMGGPKLEYAKKSVLKLVEQLQPGDVAGLITFSNNSRVDVKPQPVTAKLKDRLKAVVTWTFLPSTCTGSSCSRTASPRWGSATRRPSSTCSRRSGSGPP
jgi:hypothetical protein